MSFSSWRRDAADINSDSDDGQTVKSRTTGSIYVYDSDGGSDSEATSLHSKCYVPDSDEAFSPNTSRISSSVDRRSVVPDTDESDESDSPPSQFGIQKNKSHRESLEDSSTSVSNFMQNRSTKFSDKDDSSPEITKTSKRRNKIQIIFSDEENSSVKSTAFNISDVMSDESNSAVSANKEECEIEDQDSCTNNYNISEDEESPRQANRMLETSPSNQLPTIDLTLPISDSNQRVHENVDLTNKVKSDFRDKKVTGTITISSDSEDDKRLLSHRTLPNEAELNTQLSKVDISRDDKFTQPKEDKKKIAKDFQNNFENDYYSRLESLKTEKTRLEAQVKEVLKNIDSVKSTLKTANMAALPDRGVRLQVNLKQYESKLRDLRYQQNTLSNEIIRLQMMPNTSSVPKPIQTQHTLPKIYKLPTTSTDINAMGKKALETHRTQQALTVDALRGLHNSLKNCPSEDTMATDPQGLKVELMPHQKYALAWLMWREREKPSGGILADDMGLGKTLTMIALILKSNEEKHDNGESEESEDNEDSPNSNWLSSHRRKLTPGKTLVVCPASLLCQWKSEAQRRVQRGTIDVLVHHGQTREKKARRLAKHDIVITTYNIIARDSEQPESPLFQVKWERIILDEAHQIRNHKTKTAQSVFLLKGHSRWVLTGTPVQNKELDLYALLKFLRCSPFDDLAVWKAWVDNRNVAGKQRLNTIIKSIMLRRTKKGLQEAGELKDLPDKHFETVMIKMDKEEWAIYEKLLNFSKTLFATFLHQKAEKENALQGTPLNARNIEHAEDLFKNHPELARLVRQMKEISDVKSHHILVLLLRLRQFCCHPSLIQSMLEKDDISNVGIEDSDGLDIDLMDKMTRMSLGNEKNFEDEKADLTVLDKDNPLFSKDRLSSKLRKVMETIDEILTTNEKMLVVSQWVSYLDLVHMVLKEKKIKCLRLTGQIAVKDRAEVVDKFNNKDHDSRVLLLSLTAGGVGLNLVGANHLLLLDLHWNPQLESQACDRIYRVGQQRNVQIYKFVTADTVEERVLNLQEKKLNVADSVLTGAKHTSSKLTLDDLKMLFKVN